MGHEIPDDWPEILDDKWYLVGVDRFVINPPGGGCSNDFWESMSCCPKGDLLNEFIRNDWQCNNKNLCIRAPLSLSQRIKSISGPFDDQGLCFDAMF